MIKSQGLVLLVMYNLPSNIKFVGNIAKHRGIDAVLIFLAAFFALMGAKAQGNEAQQQLWLISTRSAPVSGDLQSGQKAIRYWQFSPDGQWQTADEETFRAGDNPAVLTTIVIHGNREDSDDAIEFAWPIYCRMLRNCKDRPFRLVIWSWSSEQVYRHNRPDIQLKLCYCDAQSYYMAACIDHIRGEVPLSLIGYSMGARITAGALQLLAGGEVACRKLPGLQSSDQSQKRTAPIHALMVAAAIDDDGLACDGMYNLALSQVESLLVLRNGFDKVLKWYPKIYGRHGPEALGYAGLTGCGNYAKIELLDVSCEVGKAHKWKFYLTSGSLLEAIDRYTSFAPHETKGQ
jgi:hypothetical protein